MRYNVNMVGRDDDRGRPDISRGAEVPSLMAHLDLSAFRLDPLSTSLMDKIDGARTAAEIAFELGVKLDEILDRLDALAQARIISIFDNESSGQRLSRVSVVLEQAARNTMAPTNAIIDDGPTPGVSGPRISSAVGPHPDQIEDLPPKRGLEEAQKWVGVETGTLEETPFPDLLTRLEGSQFSGGVRLERAGVTVTFYLAEGVPMAVESTNPDHEHGRMMARAGKIDAPVHDAYEAAMKRGASSPVAALAQAGISDRVALGKLLAWRGGTILGEVQGWTEGTYSMSPGAPFPPKIARVRLKALHRPKINWRDAHLTPQQTERLKAVASRYMVVSPDAGRALVQMGLTSKEARLVKNIARKPMQVREALSISTLYRSLSRKLMFHLIDRDIFILHETNPEGNAPIPLEELESFGKLMERDNHFNVLSAHATSTQAEIHARYLKRLAQFDPSLYPSARQKHLEALSAIRSRIEQAWEGLREVDERRRYRSVVYGKDQLEMFYDLQIKKAEMSLRMRQNAADALELATSALELKPQSADARLILAGALAALGKTAEARRQLASIKGVSSRLASELESLRRTLSS